MHKIITKNWLLGFIEAEGTISSNTKLKKPIFEITQHVADYLLMEQIRDFLKIKSNIIFSQDRTCKISETNKKNWLLNIVPLMKEINSEKRKNQIKDHWVNYMDNENKVWGLSVPSSY